MLPIIFFILVAFSFPILSKRSENSNRHYIYFRDFYSRRQHAKELQRSFSFWDQSTIYEILKRLEKCYYLVQGKFNSKRYDNTHWYTVNINKLHADHEELINRPVLKESVAKILMCEIPKKEGINPKKNEAIAENNETIEDNNGTNKEFIESISEKFGDSTPTPIPDTSFDTNLEFNTKPIKNPDNKTTTTESTKVNSNQDQKKFVVDDITLMNNLRNLKNEIDFVIKGDFHMKRLQDLFKEVVERKRGSGKTKIDSWRSSIYQDELNLALSEIRDWLIKFNERFVADDDRIGIENLNGLFFKMVKEQYVPIKKIDTQKKQVSDSLGINNFMQRCFDESLEERLYQNI